MGLCKAELQDKRRIGLHQPDVNQISCSRTLPLIPFNSNSIIFQRAPDSIQQSIPCGKNFLSTSVEPSEGNRRLDYPTLLERQNKVLKSDLDRKTLLDINTIIGTKQHPYTADNAELDIGTWGWTWG